MACAIEDTVIAELQLRLKKPKGAEPKKEHVTVAVRLARDPSLTPSTVWSNAGVPPGGARTRIIEYRDRIMNAGMLESVVATATPGASPSPGASSVLPGLSEQLLVRQLWIEDHAPNLRDLISGPLILSADARLATREIVARVDGHDEVLRRGKTSLPVLSSLADSDCIHACRRDHVRRSAHLRRSQVVCTMQTGTARSLKLALNLWSGPDSALCGDDR